MTGLLNQITYFAFFQGFFLLAIFTFSWKKRQQINSYLLILVVVLMIGLISKIGQSSLGWHRQIKGFSEFSVLLFGPTIYLFVRSSLSDKRLSLSDVIHYFPAVIYSLIVTFYYIIPSQETIMQRVESGELYRVVHVLVGSGLAVNIIYFVRAVLQYRELRAALQQEVSYALNISFVRNFLTLIGTCLAIWLTVYLLSFGSNDQVEIIAREFIWLAIVLIVLFIAYYQMVSPGVFQFEKIIEKPKYAQSKYSSSELDQLKLQLEQVMENKKPYLNARLLKSELAQMIDVNAPELSRLLNERIGMSFFEFVNYYRIQEFIRLAESPIVKQKTLFGLAQEAGFQSKSTFNKAFRQIIGHSPSEYLRSSQ